MPSRSVSFGLCLLLLGVLPGTARAKESDPAGAAQALRAALSAPTPAISIDYRGDLVRQGLWIGETRITVRVAKVGRQPVWRITEDRYVDHAGREDRTRSQFNLGQDLRLLSGTHTYTGKTERRTLAFARKGTALQVFRTRQETGEDAAQDGFSLTVPEDLSAGLGALLLLIRAAPRSTELAYELPLLDGRHLQALESTSRIGTTRIDLLGAGTLPTPPAVPQAGTKKADAQEAEATARVEVRRGAEQLTLHLSPDRRSLRGAAAQAGALLMLPRGHGGTRMSLKPDEPARTWQAAFLKFGFGYHLPRRRLLEEAFHWDDMYAHETTVARRWDASRPLDAFRDAWVGEFVAQSKERSVEDARRLLSMTLGTGTLRKETADEVVFAAHPNFGGGVQRTYFLKRKDGVWGIVRIDG